MQFGHCDDYNFCDNDDYIDVDATGDDANFGDNDDHIDNEAIGDDELCVGQR